MLPLGRPSKVSTILGTRPSTSASLQFNSVGDSSIGISGHIEIALTETSLAHVGPGTHAVYHRFVREDDVATDTFASISTGKHHTCGVTTSGIARCWGSQSAGQVQGAGGTGGAGAPINGPYSVLWAASSVHADATDYREIASGGDHSCGINLTDDLFCWGSNAFGEAGTGATGGALAKTAIDAGTPYTHVFAGARHTCGITQTGDLKCWGANDDGQLGDGTTVLRNSPTVIDSGIAYAYVATGAAHTCGISSAGLKCWGANTFGQLGDGTTTDQTTPVLIDGATSYATISAGDYHTCGVTSTGILKCWGMNSYGQIGDATATNRSSPVVIDAGTNYRKVASGGAHTCAVTTSDTVKCWGWNQDGQLGNHSNFDSATPTEIDSGTLYSQISSGSRHTCGITTAGDTKCWGANDHGQIGTGYSTAFGDAYWGPELAPAVIDPMAKYAKVSIAAGIGCGITTTGILKCWGKTAGGLLGNGINGETYAVQGPTEIDSGTLYQEVSVSAKGSCAITTSGVMKCWGPNTTGYLTFNTTTPQLTPTTFGWPGDSYLKVAVTDTHACAINTDQIVQCWGRNGQGQLGDGASQADRPWILPIDDVDTYESITVGNLQSSVEAMTCGITTAGVLKCWGGNNQFGSIGDGSTATRLSPVVIDGGTSYASVSISGLRTCGVTLSGDVRCWGGTFGMGLASTNIGGCPVNGCHTPVDVDSGSGFDTFVISAFSACGITGSGSPTVGELKCYGDNTFGQLATGTRAVNYYLASSDVGVTYSQITISHEEYTTAGAVCGITTEGYLRCWGHGLNGSTGRTSSSNYPVTIW